MADISKIKTPDGTVYDLAVNRNHIKPLDSRTYSGVIASAASWVGASWAYGRVKPDDYYIPWRIKVKVTAEASGSNYAKASSVWVLDGVQDTYMSYSAQNAIQNVSYRPIYYHMYYRFKEAAITAGGTHAIGFSFLYSWSYTTAANARTITVELLETENCAVELLDSLQTHSTVTAQSNYSTYTTFDLSSNGLQETGDANDVNYYNREYYGSRTCKNAIYRYQVCLTDSAGKLIPVNTVNNSIATNKTLTTEAFDPFGEIFYWASTSTYTAGANVGNGNWYRQYMADLRYSFNCGGYDTTPTLTARSPLYLVCVPQSDGSAKLHSAPLSQALPTSDDGLIYIYLGRVYEDTKPYRVVLTFNHPIYWYKDGAVRLYDPNYIHINNTLIYDQTFSVSSGVATFTPHVYQKGTDVTSNYAASKFVWKFRKADGTEETLTTNSDRTCTVTISDYGYGGHVVGSFTP